jgi:crotonobetainyl-CoA:carnitine CoA-transferase CaiB-like acyl-CoA transferase
MSDLPLKGIRVLDVSTALAGPVTATLLADFGAEVVKIEEPLHGDSITRARAPRQGGRSLQWAQEGRNKQSVAIDLRQPAGQQLLRDLVPHFDVMVTNYRPPTLEKWGLSPAQMSELHPQAILLYLTGYGMTGPYRDRGAFDRVASAFSGLTYVSGEPGRTPTRSGFSVIDYMSSYLAAFSVVTALYHRDLRGGSGQVIDLALYEAAFRASEDALLDYAVNGTIRERTGNRNQYIVPATDYLAGDGRYVSVHAGTEPLLRRLFDVIGEPELIDDKRYSSHATRLENQDELYRIIEAWMGTQTASDAVKLLSEAGIPCSPVMNIADIAEDPHYLERGTIVTVEDEDFGPLPMVAPLPKMSATPGTVRTLGPRLGQHTAEVLENLLQLRPDELQELRRKKIVGLDELRIEQVKQSTSGGSKA